MADRRGISGASGYFKLNGQRVGWAQNVSATEQIDAFPVQELGEALVQEHEVTGYTVSVTAGWARIVTESLVDAGLWPLPETDALLSFPPMELEVFDKRTGKNVYVVTGVKPRSRSWTMQRGSIVFENAAFYAIEVRDADGAGS